MAYSQVHRFGKWLSFAAIAPSLLAYFYFDVSAFVLIPVFFALGFIGWYHPITLLILLWISIPFSFGYSFSDRLATDLPDEPLMLAVSILAIAHWVYRRSVQPTTTWTHPLCILFLLWLGWMAVASTLSTTPWLSFKFMLAKSWYVGAFFLAPLLWLRGKDRSRQFLYALYIPLFLLAICTLIRHAFHGFSFATVSDVVNPYFRNHVVYSAMLMTLVPVLFFSRRFVKAKMIWDVALVIVLLALFFSYARGAWLAVLIGAFAYLLLKKRLLLHGYLICILILILAFSWIRYDNRYLDFAPDYRTTIFHPDFKEHWQATYEGKDVSTVERYYRWIAGVRMVEERPWSGFGPASFYTSYRPYTIPAFKTWVSNNPERSTVHNYFLLTAAEQGLPGLIIFLLLFGAILFYAEKIHHVHQSDWARQMAGGIAVIAVMLGVVNFWSDLIETDKIGSLFFLSIALLLSLDRDRSGIGAANIQGIA